MFAGRTGISISTHNRRAQLTTAEEIHALVASALEALAGTYPPGSVAVDSDPEGVSVRVRPVMPVPDRVCAPLDVDIDPDGRAVYLAIGRDGALDMPTGEGWIDPRFTSYMDGVTKVARAVIEGRVREDVWRDSSGRVTSSCVLVDLAQTPLRIVHGVALHRSAGPSESLDYSAYPGID